MNRVISIAVAVLALAIAAPVLAQPAVTIDIVAESEVVDATDGTLRRVPAENVMPGAEVIYTVIYANAGDELASEVVIDNPIPGSVSYIPESATPDSGEVTFSIDNGETFAVAEELTHEIQLPNGRRATKPVPAEFYTHVRWTITAIEPGARGDVAYRARVR